jgi:hypothetical protein
MLFQMNKWNKKSGLYLPQLESDSCGVGMVCKIDGEQSHDVIDGALQMLEHMEHRGAYGAEENTGDVRRGQSLVVWAISEGRAAAEALHADIQQGVN